MAFNYNRGARTNPWTYQSSQQINRTNPWGGGGGGGYNRGGSQTGSSSGYWSGGRYQPHGSSGGGGGGYPYQPQQPSRRGGGGGIGGFGGFSGRGIGGRGAYVPPSREDTRYQMMMESGMGRGAADYVQGLPDYQRAQLMQRAGWGGNLNTMLLSQQPGWGGLRRPGGFDQEGGGFGGDPYQGNPWAMRSMGGGY